MSFRNASKHFKSWLHSVTFLWAFISSFLPRPLPRMHMFAQDHIFGPQANYTDRNTSAAEALEAIRCLITRRSWSFRMRSFRPGKQSAPVCSDMFAFMLQHYVFFFIYYAITTQQQTIKEKKSWKKGKTKYTNDIDYCLSIKIKCVSEDKKINLFHHVQYYVYFKGIKNF